LLQTCSGKAATVHVEPNNSIAWLLVRPNILIFVNEISIYLPFIKIAYCILHDLYGTAVLIKNPAQWPGFEFQLGGSCPCKNARMTGR
jgi:hypothetical protein